MSEVIKKAHWTTRRRDLQVQRKVSRFTSLSKLNDIRYRPALQSLARLTILSERAYAHLKDRKSLLDEHGELCRSIDVARRLIDSQTALLKQLGLTPNSSVAEPDDFEAAFERIETMKKARDTHVKPNGNGA